MRQLYKLPGRTLNNLLYLISKDQPIDVQLHLRIMKYVMSNLKSTNSLVRLSTKLCMSEANRSHVRVSITLCKYYGLNKFQVSNYDSWLTIKKYNGNINVSESKVKDEKLQVKLLIY